MEDSNELILSPQSQDEKSVVFPLESLPGEIIENVLIYVSTFRSVWKLRSLSKFFFGMISSLFTRRLARRDMNCPLLYESRHCLFLDKTRLVMHEPERPFFCISNRFGMCYDAGYPVLLGRKDLQPSIQRWKSLMGFHGYLIFANNDLIYIEGNDLFKLDWNDNKLSLVRLRTELTDIMRFDHQNFHCYPAKISGHEDYVFSTHDFLMFVGNYFFMVDFEFKGVIFGTWLKGSNPLDAPIILHISSTLKINNLKSASRIDENSCLITAGDLTRLYYVENGLPNNPIIFEGCHACWKNLLVLVEDECLNLYSFTIEKSLSEKGTTFFRAKTKFIRTLLENVYISYPDRKSLTISEFGIYWKTSGAHMFYFFFSHPDSDLKIGNDSHEIQIEYFRP